MTADIYILTFCRNKELLYGTTLIFKTLRTGFPTANVRIVDNNSIHEVRSEIMDRADQSNCDYEQLDRGVPHWYFIQKTIEKHNSDRELIFLDPDILFWKNCEKIEFQEVIGGRIIKRYFADFSNCITFPRLHTSFLWIKRVNRLKELISNYQSKYFDFNPFIPYMFVDQNNWYRFDSLASLYSVIHEDSYSFTEHELSYYDHLFCGSHADLVANKMDVDSKERFLQLHSYAKSDYSKLKGIWREQELYFNRQHELLKSLATNNLYE